MATSDSASYTLRYNFISQKLEYLVDNRWVTVPLTAADISSGAATDGQVLTANGTGGSAFEDLPA
jgi:hypothetical protein